MQWIVVFISSFALSFGIGLSYSLLRTPVIQFSSLYFSFPFFILGISGFMRPLKSRLNSLMVVLLLGVFMFSLVFERKHFWLMQHQGYEQIALNFAQNRASYGDEVTLVAVGGSERMLDFYQQKYAVKGAHIFNKDRSMAEFANLVDSCKTPWFAIGWTDYSNFQWVDYVHSRYPVQLASQNWFNSAYYLFGSNQNNVQTDTDSEKTYLSEQSFSGIKDFKENDEFGLLWEIAADSALKPYSGIWVAGIELIAESTLENAALVMEVKDQNLQQAALWRAGTLNERRIAAGDTTCIVVAYHLDSGPPFKPDALLRLYVWNKGQERFKVSRRWFYVKKHDPILFGLYEPF